MAGFSFGAGSLYGIKTVAAGSVATPVKFAGFQEGSIEMTGTVKEAYGQYTFPIAVAKGTSKTTGKLKQVIIQGGAYSDLFFGGSNVRDAPVANQMYIAEDEAATIPSQTTYTVTATHGATFLQDLGCFNATTGAQMTCILTGPTVAGTYEVSAAGVYTFSAADAAVPVTLNYAYTLTTGHTLSVYNQLLGVTPSWQCWFRTQYLTKQVVFKFMKCVSSKLSFATKLEDFMMPEMDFAYFADDNNLVLEIGYPD
jgi:hypothetical protein